MGFVLVALVVLLSLGIQRYAPFMLDAEQLRAQVNQFGVLAPAVIILIQAAQVIVALVPGQVVALASGYIFGPVAGSAYSLVGVLIGSAIAFSLTKRFGRPVAERLLHEDILNRFDEFVNRLVLRVFLCSL